jgi:hypothetical protein
VPASTLTTDIEGVLQLVPMSASVNK